jgi:hypothetical protein
MLQIDLISISNGAHYLQFGMNSNELCSFQVQMWIEKFGIRMIDWCQAMGLNFITFMGGDLWIHNQDDADQNRCNLFGEKRDCIVGVVSNEEPTKIKVFDSLGVHSDSTWEITEIIIPATLNYPQGMYSKIPKERFKKRDGVWVAEFLRNMKTNSSTASVMDAINGESLRGNHIYMLMKNISDDQVKLFMVDVNSTKSKV